MLYNKNIDSLQLLINTNTVHSLMSPKSTERFQRTKPDVSSTVTVINLTDRHVRPSLCSPSVFTTSTIFWCSEPDKKLSIIQPQQINNNHDPRTRMWSLTVWCLCRAPSRTKQDFLITAVTTLHSPVTHYSSSLFLPACTLDKQRTKNPIKIKVFI